ncbi:hypothetical protein J4205_03990 [Candidatus Pacearchaeota archaeon]|nr:hypothetical protein [Candidatus Pacearchaeota archaeon]
MMISYPSGNKASERDRVSLFVDARFGESEIDNVFSAEDIFLRKPFGYWIKNEGVVVYSGPHWTDPNYNDYFWNESIRDLFSNPHEITFIDFDDLKEYWRNYHFDVEIPGGLVVSAALEMF